MILPQDHGVQHAHEDARFKFIEVRVGPAKLGSGVGGGHDFSSMTQLGVRYEEAWSPSVGWVEFSNSAPEIRDGAENEPRWTCRERIEGNRFRSGFERN